MNKSVKDINAFKSRVLHFLKIHAKKGQTRFEEYCGLSRSTINNIKDGISTASVYKIAEKYPELNLNWLITGKGEMLKTQVEPQPQAESESVSLLRTLLNEERSALKDMREKHEKLLVENALLRKEIEDTKKINNEIQQSNSDGKRPAISHKELPEPLPKLPVYTRN
jgi:transcriptional regulator with XRE-family HTH domain